MRALGAGTAGIAIFCMIGNGWAQEICARTQDLTAMQAAAVQQELMVAAFSCNDANLYNAFVNTYQKELQTSDAALQAFFLRLNQETGERDYHAYKTRLANVSSRRSAGDRSAYCARARAAFDTALNADQKNLSTFVLAQPMPADQGYAVCGISVAGGSMSTPKPPPDNPVMTAQAAAEPPAPPADPVPPVVPPRVAAAPPVAAPPTGGLARERTPNEYANRAPAYAANDEPQTAQSPRYAPPRARAYRYPARERYSRAYDEYGYWNRYGEWVPYANPYGRYERYYRGVPRQVYPWRR